MTAIDLNTANKVEIVESIEQMTLPAAEAITAGMAVRIDTSAGTFTKANGSTAAEARAYGVATKTVVARQAVTAIRKGVMDGWDISGLAYDADVFLSDTDGRLDTAAGTVNVKVGRVIPVSGAAIGAGFDKVLAIDLTQSGQQAEDDSAYVAVTTELLAASVDKWMFVADRAYEVIGFREIHSVVGGSGAVVRPRKIAAATTAAPGASVAAGITELTTADIGLETSINVSQTPTITATAADALLAAGDKVGLNFSGTLTGLVGHLTMFLKPI